MLTVLTVLAVLVLAVLVLPGVLGRGRRRAAAEGKEAGREDGEEE